MTERAFNLLTEPLIHGAPRGFLTLPGLLAALARDEVESFPALRPHQGPSWHTFLVQLAALALHSAGPRGIPELDDDWLVALRNLTPGFADDEPWCLVADDWAKPAFLQSPVPDGVKLGKSVSSPDALDLLITARNHDLKHSIARRAKAEDWLFALVSLQTGGTYSKAGRDGNYWNAVRTGNIYAPRVLVGLAPWPPEEGAGIAPRPGTWFRRDVSVLLETRKKELDEHGHLEYSETSGYGLTWIPIWREGEQLQLKNLDIWFIEVCRRLRLQMEEDAFIAHITGTTKSRINASDLGGNLGDPWTPIHKDANGKALGLSEGGFHYKLLTKVLFGERSKGRDIHDWVLPILLKPTKMDSLNETLLLVAQGIAGQRQKSGTLGFHSRILPLGGKTARALSIGSKREELHKLAQEQMEDIGKFDKTLRNALMLAIARGDQDKLTAKLKSKKAREGLYALTHDDCNRFDCAVDEIFFDHLWARFEAQDQGGDAPKRQEVRFREALFHRAQSIFEAALPAVPCADIFRPRAEARARRAFTGSVRKSFPALFPAQTAEEAEDAAA